jgi:hypothetical protein
MTLRIQATLMTALICVTMAAATPAKAELEYDSAGFQLAIGPRVAKDDLGDLRGTALGVNFSPLRYRVNQGLGWSILNAGVAFNFVSDTSETISPVLTTGVYVPCFGDLRCSFNIGATTTDEDRNLGAPVIQFGIGN